MPAEHAAVNSAESEHHPPMALVRRQQAPGLIEQNQLQRPLLLQIGEPADDFI